MRLGDFLPGGEEQSRLKIVETPFQQLLRFVGALFSGFQAVDHDDQAQPILHRRADETIAGFFGEPGLEAVRTDRHRQQRVAVVLANLVPR